MDCSKVTPVEHCDCPIKNGGWCDPHQIFKNEHYVTLCRTRPKYRKAWNECRGPLQNIEEKYADPLRKRVTYGPGSELRKCLGCSRSRKAKVDYAMMNKWDVEGCQANIDEIIGWLVASDIEAKAATRLVNIAISRAATRDRGENNGN